MSVSVEGTQGLARKKTHKMWETIWEEDPAYFSPSGRVPGSHPYFQQAWHDYNAPGLSDNSEVAAAMFAGKNIQQAYKDGFSVEESLDFDASTLHRDPKNLEKFSPVDAHPEGDEEEDDDAVEGAEVGAAAGRMAHAGRDFGRSRPVLSDSGRGESDAPRARSEATRAAPSARTLLSAPNPAHKARREAKAESVARKAGASVGQKKKTTKA